MQPAFLARESGPASGAIVFAGLNCPGAGPAANAGIAAVVEGIVGDVVIGDVAPDVSLRPVEEGIHFVETEPRIPLYDFRSRAIRGLVAANGADPGVVSDEGALERF